MLTEERLREVLQALPVKEPLVVIEGGSSRWVGVVVSEDFEGQDEAVRQDTLWTHLLEKLDEHERIGLDFVFTMSPAEYAALDDDDEPEPDAAEIAAPAR